jgi:hypothetical protein
LYHFLAGVYISADLDDNDLDMGGQGEGDRDDAEVVPKPNSV